MAHNKRWYMDDAKDACIIRQNRDVKISGWGKGKGHVWVKTEALYIVCSYISPNVTDEVYGEHLQGIYARDRGKRHIWGAILMLNLLCGVHL